MSSLKIITTGIRDKFLMNHLKEFLFEHQVELLTSTLTDKKFFVSFGHALIRNIFWF